MAKRKMIRTKWKADRKIQLANNRKQKAIRIVKHLSVSCEQKPFQINPSSFSVKRAWQKIIGILKGEFDFSFVEVIERIPNEFPAIECEPEEFQEILYHLAKNALQAMQDDVQRAGKIILRAQLAFSSQEEPFAILKLADTGPGISEERLPRLFHPFFTTRPEGEGNGLGLYLTRELVTKNKGRITASSFEGQGTTFILEFPIVPHNSQSNLGIDS